MTGNPEHLNLEYSTAAARNVDFVATFRTGVARDATYGQEGIILQVRCQDHFDADTHYQRNLMISREMATDLVAALQLALSLETPPHQSRN